MTKNQLLALKSGDKVRITRNPSNYYNHVGTVLEVRLFGSKLLMVRINPVGWWMPEYVERVE